MLCAVCVELKVEHMQDAITTIDGTCFCMEHVELYLVSRAEKLKNIRNMQTVIESLRAQET